MSILAKCACGLVVHDQRGDGPTVTTLCGSARFAGEMLTAHRRLAQNGHIVIPPDPAPAPGELHLRKIDLSDGIYVVNVSGYVGPSTKAEIAYAREHGKTVEFMYPPESIDWGSVAADGL